MDRKEAIENLKKLKSFHNGSYGSSIRMAIEALQEQDHRCDNCRNGENAGVRIYCLLHTSFHRLDEYCSEWEEE